MKNSEKNSTENYHFYSLGNMQFIVRACFPNDDLFLFEKTGK